MLAKLDKIVGIAETDEVGLYKISCRLDLDGNGVVTDEVYMFRDADTQGLAPVIKKAAQQYIAGGGVIQPYTP